MIFHRIPFLGLACMHNTHISYIVNGTKAIKPGNGGNSGKGGAGGRPGNVTVIGLSYMPKFVIFNRTGKQIVSAIFNMRIDFSNE